MQTYEYVLQPVEGAANWPISNMPRPLLLLLSRCQEGQRHREGGRSGSNQKEKKLSKVGIKMRCRLCGNTSHNARRCPMNPEAGNKKNVAIKRIRKKAQTEQPGVGTSAGTSSKKRKTGPSVIQSGGSQPMPSQGSQPIASQPSARNTRTRETRGRGTASGSQPSGSQARGPQARGSQSGQKKRRLATLLFGDNY